MKEVPTVKEIRTAMGYVETVGLAAAVAAADAALKAANVNLVGREISKGGGMVTVKISGNVGAVKAAVAAAKAEGDRVSEVVSAQVIARPAQSHGPVMGYNADTMGVEEWLEAKGIEEKPLSVHRPEGKRVSDRERFVEPQAAEEPVTEEIPAVPEAEKEPEPAPPAEEGHEEVSTPPVAEVPPAPEGEKPQAEPEKPKTAPRRRAPRKKSDTSQASAGEAKPRSTTRRTRRKKSENTDTSGRL